VVGDGAQVAARHVAMGIAIESQRIIPKPAPDAPYEIHFVASATESPWPDAIVVGNAATKERAVEMVLTAIARSDGWR
jgi:hypothetical protein